MCIASDVMRTFCDVQYSEACTLRWGGVIQRLNNSGYKSRLSEWVEFHYLLPTKPPLHSLSHFGGDQSFDWCRQNINSTEIYATRYKSMNQNNNACTAIQITKPPLFCRLLRYSARETTWAWPGCIIALSWGDWLTDPKPRVSCP